MYEIIVKEVIVVFAYHQYQWLGRLKPCLLSRQLSMQLKKTLPYQHGRLRFCPNQQSHRAERQFPKPNIKRLWRCKIDRRSWNSIIWINLKEYLLVFSFCHRRVCTHSDKRVYTNRKVSYNGMDRLFYTMYLWFFSIYILIPKLRSRQSKNMWIQGVKLKASSKGNRNTMIQIINYFVGLKK